jgi:hypothetical protein
MRNVSDKILEKIKIIYCSITFPENHDFFRDNVEKIL